MGGKGGGGGGGKQNKLRVLVYRNMATREESSQIQNDHQLSNISSFCWLNDLPTLHFLVRLHICMQQH